MGVHMTDRQSARHLGLTAAAGVFFDFDGTLAGIQEDPATVEPVPGVIEALRSLAASAKVVGIVSARPVSFLAERFGAVPNLRLSGLYGLESSVGGELATDPEAIGWEPVIREVRERAGRELPAELLVEDKRLALTVHYRAAPQLRSVAEEWVRARGAETGLDVRYGRMIAELVPPVRRDKGSVVAAWCAGLDAAWYFGDDIGDQAAFAALSARQREDPGFTAVRVAIVNSESDHGLADLADVVLDAPTAVVSYIEDLLAQSGGSR